MPEATSEPVVRVSVIRVDPQQFDMFSRLMTEAEAALAPGIQAMPGCRFFFVGADEATSSLTNVSVWDTLDQAKQLDHYEPMLALGRRWVELGATFERPIMNYATLWRLGETPPPIG